MRPWACRSRRTRRSTCSSSQGRWFQQTDLTRSLSDARSPVSDVRNRARCVPPAYTNHWDYPEVADILFPDRLLALVSPRTCAVPRSRDRHPFARDFDRRFTIGIRCALTIPAASLPLPLDCRPRFLAPRDSPPSRPIAAMCARSRLTTSPPLRPATRASSDVHSWAVPFACAARPPLLAISFWRFASIDANPLLLFPDPDIRASIKLGSCHSRPADPQQAAICEGLSPLSPLGPTLQVGAIHGPRRDS